MPEGLPVRLPNLESMLREAKWSEAVIRPTLSSTIRLLPPEGRTCCLSVLADLSFPAWFPLLGKF